jgi:iodotyrosine deiodinase
MQARRTIRELVEAEEKVNYDRRMKKSWVDDLKAMTGDEADDRLHSASGAPVKPYLTEAPAIIAMFKQTHGVNDQGKRIDNYYVNESCGIAAGFLITALHNVGLATLTSTPMGAETAIRELLGRPDNEKLFLLLPVGYPADDATVPYRTELRKPKDKLYAFY